MRYNITLLLLMLSLVLQSQTNDSLGIYSHNSAEKMLGSNQNLMIGGYGEVHYNQGLSQDIRNNGKLDVHRMVMLMGYRFDSRTRFITEIEFEHVKEVYVEQAFLQYKINSYLNLRGGLLLIPMGLVNEYHEPTAFNGVERPFIDKNITPSTWREIGIGINGNIIDASLKYQLYLINGFNGYDDSALLNGINGLRKGRQKGAESYISSPSLSGRLEFYGFKGNKIGLSAYSGKSQSSLYNGLAKGDEQMEMIADSSVVGINMLGLDWRYRYKGWKASGQSYFVFLDNTEKYNTFGEGSDLGNAMYGYYLELAYDVFQSIESMSSSLYPFIRYSNYDTHYKVHNSLMRNEGFQKEIITTGLSWYPNKGTVVKCDVQFVRSGVQDAFESTFNAGFGVMF